MFNRNSIFYILLFVAVLAGYVFNSPWYEPARVVITGSVDSADSVVNVQWDSGHGFNIYEKQQFRFLKSPGGAERPVSIVLRRGEKSNPLSAGNRISLLEVHLDGKGVSFEPKNLNGVSYVPGEGYVLETGEAEVALALPVNNWIHFLFKTNDRSGIVNISVDGQDHSIDLYRKNWEVLFAHVNFWLLDEQKQFAISFNAPRHHVETIRVEGEGLSSISNIYLRTKSNRIAVPFHGEKGERWIVDDPTNPLKRFFDPVRFFFQVVLSVFTVWMLVWLWRVVARFGSAHALFVDRKRYFFWLLLVGAIAWYALWLAAFWPGVMSVDSLNIWRAAMLPDVVIENHPLANELSYMALQFVWPHPGIVPIAQILSLSLLVAGVMFYAFRQGVHRAWILLCYLFILGSVPISLYTVTLWKDTPFALLVVFWAIVPAYCYLKRRTVGKISWSPGGVIFLILLFLALLTYRHNGLAFVFVLPPLFYVLGVIRVPKKVLVFGGCALALFVCLVVFPPFGWQKSNYFRDLSLSYISQIKDESITTRLYQASGKYPRLLDIKKNMETSDFWHYYLGDRTAYRFLHDTGWRDVFSYIPYDEVPFPALHNLALKVYSASLDYPWLYLTWYPFPFLYLFPVCLLLYRWVPLSAIFSVVVLAQVIALLFFVGSVNWRYYYFMVLGGYFLLPVLLVDLRRLRVHRQKA